MKSWKTTVGGILAAVAVGLRKAPQTAPYADFVEMVGLAMLGLAARDNNVTSEQAGAGGAAGPGKPGPNAGGFALVFLMAAIVVGLGGPSLALTGCGTPPERKAFSAAVGTRVGVELALAEFKEMARAGKVTPEQIATARKALETYKLADDAYLKALEVAVTTKDVSGLGKAVEVWRATYGNLWGILVLYEPRLDPNPPQGTRVPATF